MNRTAGIPVLLVVLALLASRIPAPHVASRAAGVDTAAAAAAAPAAPPAWPRTVADHLDGAPLSALRVLITTVPDPLESSSPRLFDERIETVRAACAATGWTFERLWLPWRDDAAAKDAGGLAHRSEPGEILFRRAVPGTLEPELLLVFVVGETPASGIHQAALRRVLDYVAALAADGRYREAGPAHADGALHVQLNAPSFTGAAESLCRTLRGSALAARGARFDLVSGSANGDPAFELSKCGGEGSGLVTFATMMVPARDLSRTLFRYLHDIGHEPSREAVLLYENTTSFGQSIGQGRAGNELRPRVLLSFPAGVSQVRSEFERQRPRTESEATSGKKDTRYLDLVFDEPRTARDALAPFSSVTARSTDLSLGALFASLEPLETKYVIIAATDVADKIFLARLVKRNRPDVTLVFFESDILLVHPAVSTDLLGALVVSSYPLVPEAQVWSYPFSGRARRIEFAADGLAGTYNAVRQLLGAPNAQLVETGFPFDANGPASPTPHGTAWIAAIGRESFWPVTARRLQPAASGATAPDVRPDAVGFDLSLLGGMILAVFVSISVVTSLVYLRLHGAALTSHAVLARWLRRRRFVPRALDLFVPCLTRGARRRQQAVLLSLFLLLGLLHACLLGLALSLLRSLHAAGISVKGFGWVAATIAVLALGTIALGTATVRASVLLVRLGGGARAMWRARFAGFGTALLLPIAILGTVTGLPAGVDGLFLVRRSLRLASGLSIVFPLLIVIAALAIFLVGLGRRARLLDETSDALYLAGFEDPRYATLRDTARDAAAAASSMSSRRKQGADSVTLRLLEATALLTALAVLFWVPIVHFDAPLDNNALGRIVHLLVALLGLVILAGLVIVTTLWARLRQFLHATILFPFDKGFASLPTPVAVSAMTQLVGGPKPIESLADSVEIVRRLRSAIEREPGLASWIGDCTGLESARLGALLALQGERLERRAAAAFAQRAHGSLGDDQPRAEAERSVAALVRGLLPFLEVCRWALREGPRVAAGTGAAGKPGPLDAAGAEWFADAERLAVLQVARFTRAVGAHIRAVLGASVACTVLLPVVIASYPFQPGRLLTLTSWVTVAVAVATVLTIAAQMDRDPVLSLMSHTEPGRVTFSRDFLAKVFLYGVIPFASVIATQFPELPSGLFSWLEPFLKTFH